MVQQQQQRNSNSNTTTNEQLATSTTIGDTNNILRVPPKHTIYQNLTLALDIAFA